MHQRVYLPNLNTVRALAALMVIVSHIERKMGIFNLPITIPLTKLGSIGVTLFFSLSGFLITYLLLLEKEKFSIIKVKDFYIRRFLRIWPLYFLVLLFVYWIIPFILPDYYNSEIERFGAKSIILNILFLTNLTIVLKLTPLIISVIWSIGIEEQFYLFWPWVVKSKNRIRWIIFIILLMPVLKILCLILSGHSPYYRVIYEILSHTRFDSMAMGGLFGILAFKKSLNIFKFKINDYFFMSKKVQLVLYLTTLTLLLLSFKSSAAFNLYNYQILPILFSAILLNLINGDTSIINLENKVTNYLGKISYSLYLLHIIVFYFIFPILKELFRGVNSYITVFSIYTIAVFASILFASLSYELIEKRFLKYKKHFSQVKT